MLNYVKLCWTMLNYVELCWASVIYTCYGKISTLEVSVLSGWPSPRDRSRVSAVPTPSRARRPWVPRCHVQWHRLQRPAGPTQWLALSLGSLWITMVEVPGTVDFQALLRDARGRNICDDSFLLEYLANVCWNQLLRIYRCSTTSKSTWNPDLKRYSHSLVSMPNDPSPSGNVTWRWKNNIYIYIYIFIYIYTVYLYVYSTGLPL
jgi:hypothetical protein